MTPILKCGLFARPIPSYDHIGTLRNILSKEMKEAKKGIGLAGWRAYRLNQGTSEDEEKEMLVTVDDWKACIVTEAPPRQGAGIYWFRYWRWGQYDGDSFLLA